jgi:hypothetical protein
MILGALIVPLIRQYLLWQFDMLVDIVFLICYVDFQVSHEKPKVAQCLYQHYCLEQVYVAAMPSRVI